MRRVRRSSFSGEVSETGGGTAVVGFDHKRRTELLAEARRKRVAWVEEARGVEEGIHGARRRREDEAAENERKAESELERLFPSAVKFHDFLSGLAGDREESPAGDLSAILQPFMVQDVDIGDDRPIPSHKEGTAGYDVFLDKLRHPRAAEVVKSLQQFVAAFKTRAEGSPSSSIQSPGPSRGAAGSSSTFVGVPVSGAAPSATGRNDWGAELLPRGGVDVKEGRAPAGVTAASMSGMMHAFLGRVESQMRDSALWRRETQAQWEETRESLERIVMHKVFDQALALSGDSRRDKSISTRLSSLGFLTEEHLGVSPLTDAEGATVTWSDAANQLANMSHMRCPGDMLQCIIKCTRIVGGLLSGKGEGGALPGADDFLPALILLVKRANPPGIHSNLEFIQSFRDPSKLLSEAGYVLTQLVSAVCFLEEVDASLLSIAHGDFERGLKGFRETARVGLQAHQLKVKKEEENERLLHSAGISSADPSGAAAAAAAATTTAASSISGEAGAAGDREPGDRVAGPVPLPQPIEPRQISPSEVRSQRAAARLSAELLPSPSEQQKLEADGEDATKKSKNDRRQNGSQQRPSSGSPSVGLSQALDRSGARSSRTQSRRGLGAQLRFVGCTAAELRMSELPALLAEHQQLARLCEELLAERGELGLRRRRS